VLGQHATDRLDPPELTTDNSRHQVVTMLVDELHERGDGRSSSGRRKPTPSSRSRSPQLRAFFVVLRRQPSLARSLLINDPSRVFIARHGRHELTNLVLTSAQVQELVERMLK